jgi:predicted RNase H-like HicB family nuclease
MGRTYDILLSRDEESGWWCASVPTLPGCFSEGSTKADALRNIREAIALHTEDEAAQAPIGRYELASVRAG